MPQGRNTWYIIQLVNQNATSPLCYERSHPDLVSRMNVALCPSPYPTAV
jgi:hypothetical protein